MRSRDTNTGALTNRGVVWFQTRHNQWRRLEQLTSEVCKLGADIDVHTWVYSIACTVVQDTTTMTSYIGRYSP